MSVVEDRQHVKGWGTEHTRPDDVGAWCMVCDREAPEDANYAKWARDHRAATDHSVAVDQKRIRVYRVYDLCHPTGKLRGVVKP